MCHISNGNDLSFNFYDPGCPSYGTSITNSLCLISLHLVELLVPVDAEGINSSLVVYTTEYTYLPT